MTIKTTLIFGLASLFILCGQQNDNKETQAIESKLVNDSTLEKIKIEATTIRQKEETVSLCQQELNKALADTTIDDYYKEIYRQEKLISADDNKMLSITENLFTENPDKDLFFFIVFTKSMNGSDGFYSEALGLSAFGFVIKKTEWFADYFNIAPKLTGKDMENWANYIYGEIQISREDEEEKAINELENKLLENIKGARKEFKSIIEKLIDKIRKAHNNS